MLTHLGQIQYLLFTAEQSSNPHQYYRQAIDLVEQHTLNIKLWHQIASKINHKSDFPHNAVSRQEEKIELCKSTEGLKLSVYILCGFYNEALNILSKLNTLESEELQSCINILRGNYELVPKSAKSTTLKFNYIFAQFQLNRYLPQEVANLGTDVDGIWLPLPLISDVCLFTALLGLKFHELKKFRQTKIYHQLNLETRMQMQDFDNKKVKLKLDCDWLKMHSKVSLQSVISKFKLNEIELLDILATNNLPYKVDFERKVVEFSNNINDDPPRVLTLTKSLISRSWTYNLQPKTSPKPCGS